jgi:amidophosphoribosyltransferase
LNIFAEELQRKRLRNISVNDVFDSVRSIMRRCKGGYAVVMLINHVGLLAFRDPNGIRPLCFGKRLANVGSNEYDYAIASESVAIDAVDPQFVLERDVQPGEAIFINFQGQFFSEKLVPNSAAVPFTPCMFEYVYFARPDSLIDGVSVYEARRRMGEILAAKIKRINPNHDIDVVIPVPETSRTAALETACRLDRPYREGFVKNRYIARTFIMPGQELRRKTVRLKLNTIRSEFKDKNVLLVDDSIVRGTTSMELVQLARDAGAKKVYFASAAPPVRFSNVYGIDIPTRAELVAHGRTEAEIAEKLNADGVIYNELDAIEDAVRSCNPSVLKDFEVSCFNGVYITDDVTPDYLLQLEESRGKARKGAVQEAAESSTSRSPNNANSPKNANDPLTSSSSSSSLINETNTDNNRDNVNKRASSCEALYNERSLYETSEKRLRVN